MKNTNYRSTAGPESVNRRFRAAAGRGRGQAGSRTRKRGRRWRTQAHGARRRGAVWRPGPPRFPSQAPVGVAVAVVFAPAVHECRGCAISRSGGDLRGRRDAHREPVRGNLRRRGGFEVGEPFEPSRRPAPPRLPAAPWGEGGAQGADNARAGYFSDPFLSRVSLQAVGLRHCLCAPNAPAMLHPWLE